MSNNQVTNIKFTNERVNTFPHQGEPARSTKEYEFNFCKRDRIEDLFGDLPVQNDGPGNIHNKIYVFKNCFYFNGVRYETPVEKRGFPFENRYVSELLKSFNAEASIHTALGILMGESFSYSANKDRQSLQSVFTFQPKLFDQTVFEKTVNNLIYDHFGFHEKWDHHHSVKTIANIEELAYWIRDNRNTLRNYQEDAKLILASQPEVQGLNPILQRKEDDFFSTNANKLASVLMIIRSIKFFNDIVTPVYSVVCKKHRLGHIDPNAKPEEMINTTFPNVTSDYAFDLYQKLMTIVKSLKYFARCEDNETSATFAMMVNNFHSRFVEELKQFRILLKATKLYLEQVSKEEAFKASLSPTAAESYTNGQAAANELLIKERMAADMSSDKQSPPGFAVRDLIAGPLAAVKAQMKAGTYSDVGVTREELTSEPLPQAKQTPTHEEFMKVARARILEMPEIFHLLPNREKWVKEWEAFTKAIADTLKLEQANEATPVAPETPKEVVPVTAGPTPQAVKRVRQVVTKGAAAKTAPIKAAPKAVRLPRRSFSQPTKD